MNIETFKIPITWLDSIIPHGWGNGYIGVPKDHPWWGMDYNDVPCEVHGGLTYGKKEHPSALKGVPTDLWWFGFDCAHYQDTPQTCPESYVDAQIKSLRQQALEVVGQRPNLDTPVSKDETTF